jgi:hypothetical protein
MRRASQPSKQRRLESPPTTGPAFGCCGGGEQPAPPLPTLGRDHDVGGQISRQRPIARNGCRFDAVRIQQRLQRHHDLQLHIHIAGAGLAGEAFHQRVGHDLISGPAIPAGFGGVGVLPGGITRRHLAPPADSRSRSPWCRVPAGPRPGDASVRCGPGAHSLPDQPHRRPCGYRRRRP